MTGGGGIRTPVPRCFKINIYMLSRLIEIRLAERQTTCSQLSYFVRFSPEAARKSRVRPACFVTPLSGPQTKPNRTGRRFRQPCATDSCQVKLGAGFLARPTGVLGMQLIRPSSGRSHSPPYSLFKTAPPPAMPYTMNVLYAFLRQVARKVRFDAGRFRANRPSFWAFPGTQKTL